MKSTFEYDNNGNRTLETYDGTTALLSRWSSYDADGRVTGDVGDTVSGGTTTHSVQSYDYRLWNGSAYAGADQGW